MRARLILGLVTVTLLTAVPWPGMARANGAFPDSGQLLLPPQRPQQIGIGTNFGLVLTDDGGKSWSWVCETEATAYGTLYQNGIDGRIFAISSSGLVYSDDDACGWFRAGGALTETNARDAWVDPSDPRRVWAVATNPSDLMTVHLSTDGGTTFGPPLFTGEPNEVLTGIESAPSDPNVVYLVSYVGPAVGANTRITRSVDGGATWQAFPVLLDTSATSPRLALVDPEDPDRIFLRLSPSLSGDSLVVSTDGGQTQRMAVTLPGRFTAFLRRSDGTLLATGAIDGAGVGFQSHDRGETFTPWNIDLPVRALAERDSVLYAAIRTFSNDSALFASHDEGASWQPVIAYQQVQQIKPCVHAACQITCAKYAEIGLWPASMCSPGGNTGSDGSSPDGNAAGNPVADNPDSSQLPGCGCRAAGGHGSGVLAPFLGTLGWAMSSAQRRRWRRARARPLSGDNQLRTSSSRPTPYR